MEQTYDENRAGNETLSVGAAPALKAASQALLAAKARPEAAQAMIEALKSVATAPDKAEVAKVLLGALEEPHFKLAVNEKGESVRSAAISALLSLGYPHALQVHPDDLLFFRRGAPKTSVARWLLVAVVVLIGAIAGASAYLRKPTVHDLPHVSAPVKMVSSTSAPAPPVVAPMWAFKSTPSGGTFHGSQFANGGKTFELAFDATQPFVDSARVALEKNDLAGALEALKSCRAYAPQESACAVLRVVALRTRDEGSDFMTAQREMTRLSRLTVDPATKRALDEVMGLGTFR